jgi:alkylhydroperoxidase family enzyme
MPPVIRLPTEEEHNENVRKLDQMIRQYSNAKVMTPFVRAAGLRPMFLLGSVEELAYVMATHTLTNEQKRIIALAVGSAIGSRYELQAHATALQTQYGFTAEAVVELAAAISHAVGLIVFEKAALAFRDAPPFAPMDQSTPILQEIRKELGTVPALFRYMAHDAKFARIVVNREKAAILEPGEVSRVNKELVAYAVSLMNAAPLSSQYRADNLRQQGLSNEQLFEATTVIAAFAKNAAFSTTLQLEREGI